MTILFVEIYIGDVSFQSFVGDIYRVFDAPPGGTGGATRGWGYHDGPNAINRSLPEFGDGDAAIGQWLTGGGCRPGWDIVVNGQHVCHGPTM